MVEHTVKRVPAGPTTTEAFIADRTVFWTSFTRFVTYAVLAVVILLVLMTVFLV